MDMQHPVAQKLLKLVEAAGTRIAIHKKSLFDEGGINEEMKLDGTPVTLLDKEINNLFTAFAEHNDLGFIGEEGNGDFLKKRYVLLVDPIDGTAAFVRGMNTATVIATIMEMNSGIGIPILSFIHEPLHPVTWVGQHGQLTQIISSGKTRNLFRLDEEVAEPIRAYVCSFPGASHNLAKVKAAIEVDRAFSHQELGGFGYSAGLIACEIMHASVIGATSAVEAAAMSLIVKGVGGIAINLDGMSLIHFRLGTVRGKTDFELPKGALFASNMSTARKMQRHIMEANVR